MVKIFRNIFRKRKVALVLGSGAARGLAHIGVIKALERAQIPIDMVVGVSIGALIGAAYALGLPIEKVEKRALRLRWKDLRDLIIPKIALNEGRRLEEVIRATIDNRNFSDLKLPMTVVTTDIESGEAILFKTGTDMTKIIRASCSLPGIFTPVEIDGNLLVDGGIKNSVPVKIARKAGATFIIAVDVGYCVKKGSMHNILQILMQAFQIKGEELNRWEARDADVIIRPDIGDVEQLDFSRSAEIIGKGQEAAEAMMGKIKARLGKGF